MIAFSRAISGLRVAEQNLYVTSNNISNVNTEGYHRQRLVQSELQKTSRGNFSVGLGVDASHVKQVRLEYLETNYRNELPALGEYKMESQVYNSLQSIIGSDGSSLQDTLSNLWESFNELSKEYTTSVAGGYLRENAVALVGEFNGIEDQLIKMQNELDIEVDNVVEKINDYAKRIANLNDRITSGEAGGVLCCELRDSRESLIAGLAELIDIQVEDFSDTAVNIRCGNGHLVVGTNTNRLSTAQNIDKSTFRNPVWESTGQAVEVNSGTLKGILDMRGENVVGNYASSTNGSPKEKMDVVVSIDKDLSLANIERMRNNITTMMSTLDRQGANYQFYTNNGEKIDGNTLKLYTDYLYGSKMSEILDGYAGDNKSFTDFIDSVKGTVNPEQVIKEYMEDKGVTLDLLKNQFAGDEEMLSQIEAYELAGGDSVIGFQMYVRDIPGKETLSDEVQDYLNGTILTVDGLKGYIEDKMVNIPVKKVGEIDKLINSSSSKVLDNIDKYDTFIKYREDSNKYMLVFTDQRIDPGTDIEHTTAMLNKIDMRLITITNEASSKDWMKLAQDTGGNVLSIEDFDSKDGAENLGLAISRDFNSRLDATENTDGIPAFRAGLNKILNGLTNEVNAIFRQGANIYGNRHGDVIKDEFGNDVIDDETGKPSTYNLDLFLKIDEKLPLQMGNIKINPLFSDLNNMPLSLTGDTGDFQIGRMLVDLTNTDVFNNGNSYSTVDEQYASFILNFGQAANIAISGAETQENVINAASEKLSAVSGVSMDEELSNMVKFQYSYTAASKMIKIVDEMLETVINI